MAKLSDHVFPESVWKAFGEHMGEEEEEGGIRKKEEEEQEEEEEDASWEPLGALLGPPGGVAVLAQVWAKAISGGSSLRLRAARASCGAGRAHAAVRRSSGSRRS